LSNRQGSGETLSTHARLAPNGGSGLDLDENVRTQTLRAFSADEMKGILGKVA
jgi:hypothetical protein